MFYLFQRSAKNRQNQLVPSIFFKICQSLALELLLRTCECRDHFSLFFFFQYLYKQCTFSRIRISKYSWNAIQFLILDYACTADTALLNKFITKRKLWANWNNEQKRFIDKASGCELKFVLFRYDWAFIAYNTFVSNYYLWIQSKWRN